MAATSVSIITPTTSGFQQRQQQQRASSSSSMSSMTHVSMSGRVCSSSMRISATMNEATITTEAATTPNDVGDAPARKVMTYADVNSLTFRELQRECKALGLSAIGTTSALRGRLLNHHGLERVVRVDVTTPAASAAEIEVSFVCVPPPRDVMCFRTVLRSGICLHPIHDFHPPLMLETFDHRQSPISRRPRANDPFDVQFFTRKSAPPRA